MYYGIVRKGVSNDGGIEGRYLGQARRAIASSGYGGFALLFGHISPLAMLVSNLGFNEQLANKIAFWIATGNWIIVALLFPELIPEEGRLNYIVEQYGAASLAAW